MPLLAFDLQGGSRGEYRMSDGAGKTEVELLRFGSELEAWEARELAGREPEALLPPGNGPRDAWTARRGSLLVRLYFPREVAEDGREALTRGILVTLPGTEAPPLEVQVMVRSGFPAAGLRYLPVTSLGPGVRTAALTAPLPDGGVAFISPFPDAAGADAAFNALLTAAGGGVAFTIGVGDTAATVPLDSGPPLRVARDGRYLLGISGGRTEAGTAWSLITRLAGTLRE